MYKLKFIDSKEYEYTIDEDYVSYEEFIRELKRALKEDYYYSKGIRISKTNLSYLVQDVIDELEYNADANIYAPALINDLQFNIEIN